MLATLAMATRSASTASHFVHSALDDSEQQIRLLKLHPGPSESEIRCDISTYSIEESPPYIALSYTWGNPLPTHNILLNSRTCLVRGNLFNFLDTFRNDCTNIKHLWIDYICIDQSNVRERNHQVQLMGSIYRNCTFVITWLGSDPIQVAGAKQYLITDDVEDLRLLLNNDYFQRLWIVQEVLLAPEVRIFCGHVWISEADICTFVRSRTSSGLPRAAKSLFGERSLASRIKQYGAPEQLSRSLSKYLRNYSASHCDDPRDKVYGILGLVPLANIEIDYAKSKEAVYLDTITSLAAEYIRTSRFPDPKGLPFLSSAVALALNMSLKPSVAFPAMIVVLTKYWAIADTPSVFEISFHCALIDWKYGEKPPPKKGLWSRSQAC